MRKSREFQEKFKNDVIVTVPDQSFTPREILEQFARNEIVPSYYNSSDTIDDSSYSEEELCDNVIEFEDPLDAENYLMENQYALQSETNKGQSSVSEGTSHSSEQTPSGSEQATQENTD